MIEALEIGISLALADGVSEGIAAARSDLHGMEAAMTAGAVSVQRLRDVAAGALGLAQAANLHPVVKDARPVKDDAASAEPGRPAQEEDVDLAHSPTRTLPPVRSAEKSLIGDGQSKIAAPPGRGVLDTPGPLAAKALTAVSAPGVPVTAPSASIVREGPGPVGPVAPEEFRSLPAPARPTPAVTILHMEAEAPPGRSLHSPVIVRGAGEVPVSSVRHSEALSRSAPVQPVAAAPATIAGSRFQGPIVDDRPETEANSAAAAPVFVQQQAFLPRQEGSEGGSASRAASSPAGPSGEQARIEGDVFLDGLLVGRWISKYLTREAGRASAGPTGFDSRRAPLLPGATVGM